MNARVHQALASWLKATILIRSGATTNWIKDQANEAGFVAILSDHVLVHLSKILFIWDAPNQNVQRQGACVDNCVDFSKKLMLTTIARIHSRFLDRYICHRTEESRDCWKLSI
jgi:hypothetical protein